MKNKMEMEVVKKSSQLVNARYSLPVGVQKLVAFAATKIEKVDTDGTCKVRVLTNEFNKIANYAKPTKELERLVDELYEASFYVKDENYKYLKKRWITDQGVLLEKSGVDLVFHKDLTPFLYQLREHYIEYAPSEIIPLENSYALRMYEILIQHIEPNKTDYEIEFDLENFKEMLMLEDKYPKVYELKRNVINKVIEQLNKTKLENVDCLYNKTGRIITSISFVFNFYSGK